VQSYPETLLCRFFALHELRLGGSKGKYVSFVVMENLLAKARDLRIDEVYDLKGGWERRPVALDTAVSPVF